MSAEEQYLPPPNDEDSRVGVSATGGGCAGGVSLVPLTDSRAGSWPPGRTAVERNDESFASCETGDDVSQKTAQCGEDIQERLLSAETRLMEFVFAVTVHPKRSRAGVGAATLTYVESLGRSFHTAVLQLSEDAAEQIILECAGLLTFSNEDKDMFRGITCLNPFQDISDTAEKVKNIPTVLRYEGSALLWLQESFERCSVQDLKNEVVLVKEWRTALAYYGESHLSQLVEDMRQCIVRYAGLLICCPGLFAAAPDEGFSVEDIAGILASWFASGAAHRFVAEVWEVLVDNDSVLAESAVAQLCTYVSRGLAWRSLHDQRTSLVKVLKTISSHKQLAMLLLSQQRLFSPPPENLMSATKDKKNGYTLQTDSILGGLFTPTPLDQPHYKNTKVTVKERIFGDVGKKTPQALTQALQRVRREMAVCQTETVEIIKNLCKTSKRHVVLEWFIDFVSANEARTTLQGQHTSQMIRSQQSLLPFFELLTMRAQGLSTVGVCLSVVATLLALAEPIKRSRVADLDPTFPLKAYVEFEKRKKEGKERSVDLSPEYHHLRLLGNPVVDDGGLCSTAEEAVTSFASILGESSSEDLKFTTEIFWITLRGLRGLLAPALTEYKQLVQRLQTAKEEGSDGVVWEIFSEICCWNALLFDPPFLSSLGKFIDLYSLFVTLCLATFDTKGAPVESSLAKLERTNFKPQVLLVDASPLAKVSPQFAMLPVSLLTPIAEIISFCASISPDTVVFTTNSLSYIDLDPFISLSVIFLASTENISNPHTRRVLGALPIIYLLMAHGGGNNSRNDALLKIRRSVVESIASQRWMIRGIVANFVDAQRASYYDRVEQRLQYVQLLQEVLEHDEYKTSLIDFSEKAAESRLFEKFVHHFVANTSWVLEEGMSYLSEIKKRTDGKGKATGSTSHQQHGPSADGTNQGTNGASDVDRGDDAQVEMGHNVEDLPMERLEYTCQSLMKVGETSLKVYLIIAKICGEKIINSQILRQEAVLNLNSCLDQLVGSRCLSLKVANMQKYNFDPRFLLVSVVKIYMMFAAPGSNPEISLKKEVLEEIVNEERFFKLETFHKTCRIMARESLVGSSLISDFERLTDELKTLVDERNACEEALEQVKDEIPEEFLDPIIGDIMRDPVLLPSSGVVMDRLNIERHLIGDELDPFNRKPLKREQLLPQPELKERIQQWLRETLKKQ